jgi:hypothetical protein
MFAKIAKFRVASARQAAPRSATLAHSNDNTMIARAAGGPPRTRRPNLACHWRPMIGGGFECCWDIELVNGAATEEPDQRLFISGHPLPTLPRTLGRVGRGLAAGRFAVLAAG